MASRRGFHQGRTRSRRATTWALGPQARDGTIAATGQAAWSAGVVTVLGEVTLIRTRGHFRAQLNSGDAAGSGFLGAVGIGMTTQVAFTAGGTSLPGPLDQEGWDGWLWHQYFDIRMITATIADGVNAGAVFVNIPVDSKAMRKLDEDMVFFGMIDVVESGTAVMEFQADSRMLFKV